MRLLFLSVETDDRSVRVEFEVAQRVLQYSKLIVLRWALPSAVALMLLWPRIVAT